jgi:hypothetical protein
MDISKLTREQLEAFKNCTSDKDCDNCKVQPICVICSEQEVTGLLAETALSLMDELEQANKTIHIQTYGKYGTLQYAENLDRASKTIDEFVSCKDELSGRIMQMDTVLKQAKKALEMLHPMNPDERCFVYDVWECIKDMGA